jgi:hypothetical protein
MTDEIPVPASTVRTLVQAAVPQIEEQSSAGRVHNSNDIQASVAHAIHRDNVLSKQGELIPIKEAKLLTLKAFARVSSDVEGVYEAQQTADKFIENQHEKN